VLKIKAYFIRQTTNTIFACKTNTGFDGDMCYLRALVTMGINKHLKCFVYRCILKTLLKL